MCHTCWVSHLYLSPALPDSALRWSITLSRFPTKGHQRPPAWRWIHRLIPTDRLIHMIHDICIYIYMRSIYCYMEIWELYRLYGNYTEREREIEWEREREKEWEPCCQRTAWFSLFAVRLRINMRYDGDMQCTANCPWLKRRKNWRGSPKAEGHVLGNGSGWVVRPESGALLIFSPRNSHHYMR